MTDLPTTRPMGPPPDLEDRVVRHLRSEGLLAGGPRRRPRPVPWLAAAAAAALVFTGGFAAGQRSGTRAAIDLVAAVRGGDAQARAAQVQRTGSLYVQAVNALDPAGSAGADAEGAGREVALATLRAAVAELVRLYPSDPELRQTLDLLSTRPATTDAARSLLWF